MKLTPGVSKHRLTQMWFLSPLDDLQNWLSKLTRCFLMLTKMQHTATDGVCAARETMCQFHQHFMSSFFCTKVFWAAFLYLRLRFVFFWRKDIGAKAACKMLVKLTTWANFTIILWAAFAPVFHWYFWQMAHSVDCRAGAGNYFCTRATLHL